MSLQLRAVLQRLAVPQRRFAGEVGISPAGLSQIVSRDAWPKRERAAIRDRIRKAARAIGATPTEISGLFKQSRPAKKQRASGGSRKPVAGKGPCPSPGNRSSTTAVTLEITEMLLRRHHLTQAAKDKFKLFRSPFADDLDSQDEVFLTPDIRRVREGLWHTARKGGMLAVVGESGAGKSTLRMDLIERLNRANESVVVIEPYVLGMEENDVRGKTLKSTHIAESILAALKWQERPKRSPEARFRQVHEALKVSSQSGARHLLLIEEAHGLPVATLKHLKRWYELADGFKKLLGVVLLGQPELEGKLDVRNAEVREVAQRCEVLRLEPLDNHLDAYVKHRCERAGAKVEDLFDRGAHDATRMRLTVSRGREAKAVSLLYPLAVNNLLTAALNAAAAIGAPKVDADLVAEARL
jgi:type II secretory pathway predicted ATPase ExeA